MAGMPEQRLAEIEEGVWPGDWDFKRLLQAMDEEAVRQHASAPDSFKRLVRAMEERLPRAMVLDAIERVYGDEGPQ